jgi:hypothetical protein
MIVGLHAGHGDLLGVDYLRDLKRRGAKMARVQVYKNTPSQANPTLCSPSEAFDIVQEVYEADLQPLVIIRDPEQLHHLPHHSYLDVNVGNEPDLMKFGWDVDTYNHAVRAAIEIVKAHYADRIRLRVGVVSNPNSRGLSFLRSIPWSSFPVEIVGCDYHRYPVTGGTPEMGHNKTLFGSRRTREWEVGEIRRIVGDDRSLSVSEVGYNSLEFDELTAALHFTWERQFLERMGHDFAIAYQVEDGPQSSKDVEAHYGFKDLETQQWKAQMSAWTGVWSTI